MLNFFLIDAPSMYSPWCWIVWISQATYFMPDVVYNFELLIAANGRVFLIRKKSVHNIIIYHFPAKQVVIN